MGITFHAIGSTRLGDSKTSYEIQSDLGVRRLGLLRAVEELSFSILLRFVVFFSVDSVEPTVDWITSKVSFSLMDLLISIVFYLSSVFVVGSFGVKLLSEEIR